MRDVWRAAYVQSYVSVAIDDALLEVIDSKLVRGRTCLRQCSYATTSLLTLPRSYLLLPLLAPLDQLRSFVTRLWLLSSRLWIATARPMLVRAK